jgi:hypothetical protein
VRRRYGSVFSHHDPHAKCKRYYEYTLLHQREDRTTFEDKSALRAPPSSTNIDLI